MRLISNARSQIGSTSTPSTGNLPGSTPSVMHGLAFGIVTSLMLWGAIAAVAFKLA